MYSFGMERMQSLQKAHLDGFQQLMETVYQDTEELSRLYLKNIHAATTDHCEHVRKLLSVRDPQAFFDLQATYLARPNEQAERFMEFNRQAYDLFSHLQAEITRLAERQITATAQQVQEMEEEFSRNAPSSANPAMTMFRSAVETASNMYENADRATQQAFNHTGTATRQAAEEGARAAQQATEETANAAQKASDGAARATRQTADDIAKATGQSTGNTTKSKASGSNQTNQGKKTS